MLMFKWQSIINYSVIEMLLGFFSPMTFKGLSKDVAIMTIHLYIMYVFCHEPVRVALKNNLLTLSKHVSKSRVKFENHQNK